MFRGPFGAVLFCALVLTGALLAYLVWAGGIQAEGDDEETRVQKLLAEIGRDRTAIEVRRAELDRLESSLRTFQSELDRRAEGLTQQEARLKKMESDLNDKMLAKAIDRKMIETFEAIDPDQGAVLLLNLMHKDAPMAQLLIRKMTGKKAGKILESLIQLDPAAATDLAKGSIDLFKPAPVQ
ncbi:MAG TPA: hypothetical protein PKK12_14065 [Candidatus Aminicenantes bacterium]|nr:hypothetical protein [Candidatus Aminicenantes bacterium]